MQFYLAPESLEYCIKQRKGRLVGRAIVHTKNRVFDRFFKIDEVEDELNRIMGTHKAVMPATIIVTTAGQLEKTHRVKMIFHAASVAGAVGRGFSPIPNVVDCISNSLAKVDDPQFKDAGLTSILFPLMGTGAARGDLLSTVGPLIEAAVAYLSQDPACNIRRAYFIAWSEEELAACRSVLDHSPAVSMVRKIDSQAGGLSPGRGNRPTRRSSRRPA
jgi:O-acetyl-ADP-ribose deacetylase (regulator of RNase III)